MKSELQTNLSSLRISLHLPQATWNTTAEKAGERGDPSSLPSGSGHSWPSQLLPKGPEEAWPTSCYMQPRTKKTMLGKGQPHCVPEREGFKARYHQSSSSSQVPLPRDKHSPSRPIGRGHWERKFCSNSLRAALPLSVSSWELKLSDLGALLAVRANVAGQHWELGSVTEASE